MTHQSFGVCGKGFLGGTPYFRHFRHDFQTLPSQILLDDFLGIIDRINSDSRWASGPSATATAVGFCRWLASKSPHVTSAKISPSYRWTEIHRSPAFP